MIWSVIQFLSRQAFADIIDLRSRPYLEEHIKVCQPQTGTCHGHLPSASPGIRPCAALAADLQLLLQEFRAESRSEAVHATGSQDWSDLARSTRSQKTGRTGLQVVRYDQELILWVQFFYLFISRKNIKTLHDDDYFSWLAEASPLKGGNAWKGYTWNFQEWWKCSILQLRCWIFFIAIFVMNLRSVHFTKSILPLRKNKQRYGSNIYSVVMTIN